MADEVAAAVGALKVVDKLGVQIEKLFRAFLDQPHSDARTGGNAALGDYTQQIQTMIQQRRNTVFVDYVDVQTFDPVLADTIAREYYRYEPFLRHALLQVVRRLDEGYARDGNNSFKDFWIGIMGLPAIHKIRDLKTSKIGSLISISGTVTRTSEVRPELISATFACMECGTVVRNVEQQFKYTEPPICTGQNCGNRTRWELNVEQSKFSDWQRVRVQENSNEIPAGAMPRSLDVILRNQIVDKVKPGDKVVFTGTLIVIPDVSQLGNAAGRVETRSGASRGMEGMAQEGTQGLRMLGVRELTYKLCFLANMAQPAESRSNLATIRDDTEGLSMEEFAQEFSEEERAEILRMRSMANLEEALINSVAPNVYGHDAIKRAVLLMLFGGVHKRAIGGVNLRGDINVCIVGDPSTAKSQFLKYVVSFLPRAIYTSGKASSAAGLTASVVKDDETGEFTIEAGALMLADNGVCCIDEFDKMDIADQVAIHEAMEQQTISIAKAGIQATLNARTSILAAANPQGGRYDQRFSLKHNVDMSPAIMSRFDLFFVIIDECDPTADFNIAKHIVEVHRKADRALRPEFTTEQLQRYIKFARILKPKISAESAKLLVKYYRQLRQSDAGGVGKSSFRITVRQLESMVRLSEALARLHLEDEVKPKYVENAYQLLCKSIIHVETEDIDFNESNGMGAGAGTGGRDNNDDDDDDDLPPGPNTGKAATTGDATGPPSGTTSTSTSNDGAHAAVSKPTIKLSLVRYKQITNMLVLHLRRSEDIEARGLRQSELVQWYLEQIEDEITTEKQLLEQQELIRLVIKNLIIKDRILIRLREVDDATAMQTDGAEPVGSSNDDPILVVHANYVVE